MPADSLRVLRVLPTLGAGGTERQSLEIAEHIRNREAPGLGPEVLIDILTVYGPQSLHTLQPPSGIRVIHLNLPRGVRGILRSAPELRRLSTEYDVVHAMLWPAIWAVAKADLATPWIASLHGSALRGGPLNLKLLIDRAAFSKAAMVVFNSHAGCAALVPLLRIPRTKTTVIFNSKKVFDGAVQERSGVLCSARYMAPKRHDLLLRALAFIEPGKRPPLNLIGLGTSSPRALRDISQLGLSRVVAAHGEVDDPLRWLAGAQLAALPSDHEGMPNTVLEAWATGTPVLASRVAGIEELIRHGVDGWLVGNDAREWADAIELLLGDAGLRTTLGDNGQQRLKSDFSMNAAASAWIQLYRSVSETASGYRHGREKLS